MKRCLIPGILALGIHGLLFAMEFNWPTGESFFHPKVPAITMTLSYFQTEKPQPMVTPSKPTPAPKKIIKKIKQARLEPKPIHKPKPDFIPLPKPKTNPIAKKMSDPVPQPEKIEIRSAQKSLQSPLDTFEPFTPVVFTRSTVPQPKVPPAPVIRKAKPLYRHNPPPRYPRLARKRKYQGVVILEVFVNRDGSVGDAKVFKSSGYAILDKTAMKSVKKWEFEPGKRGDENVGMWVRVPVRYRLK
jgi:protein TonB